MKTVEFKEGSALHKLYLHLIPKRRAFQKVFLGAEHAGLKKIVLLEFAKFCRAEAPCKTEREEGRREVWLMLRKYLHLPDEELTVMYTTLTAEQRYQIYHPSATFTE